MESIKIRSRVGADGILNLQVPLGVKDTTVEVVIIFYPVDSNQTTDDHGWPIGFFERTAGSIPDFPLDADEGFEIEADGVVATTARADTSHK